MLIAISCSTLIHETASTGPLPHHAVFDRYVGAVAETCRTVPVLLPAIGGADLSDLVGRLDGIVLTGDASDVAGELYGCPKIAGAVEDAARDSLVLPLVRAALEAGVPLFGICRGCQELNVALGGTLEPCVREIPGRDDHRSDPAKPFAERYGPAHGLRLAPGGWLEQVIRCHGVGAGHLRVNSLHRQAIARTGRDVTVEARAEDGTIEAVRVARPAGFALGVQFHPEWHHAGHPLYRALWEEFRAACSDRARARTVMHGNPTRIPASLVSGRG